MKRVAITGVGYTAVSEHWDRGLRSLFAEAGRKALEDAGISEVDAVIVGNMAAGVLNRQYHLGALCADELGFAGVPAWSVEAACASGGVAVYQSILAVASGLFDRVLVVGVEKMTDASTPEVTDALVRADEAEVVDPTGLTFVGLNALLARLYLKRYGVSMEQIAPFPVLCHRNAVNNPAAQYRFAITVEQVLNSPLIADPLRLLDCAGIGDGAAAVVIESFEFARQRLGSDVIVEVVGAAVATDRFRFYERDDPTHFFATRQAAREAFHQAGLEPKNIDVLEIHDAFSILAPIHLEDLGFTPEGQGWRPIVEGELEIGARLPTNTMGGLKARGHPVGATGVYQVAEVVQQLRGRCGPNQVSGAEVGLAQNVGGLGTTVSVIILRRAT